MQVLSSQFTVGSDIGFFPQTLCRNFSGIVTVEMQETPSSRKVIGIHPCEWIDVNSEYLIDLNLPTLVSLCRLCLLPFSYVMCSVEVLVRF